MNNTILPEQTKANLKDLVSRIENINNDLKWLKNKYTDSVFRTDTFTEEDIKNKKRYKKLKKEYQKAINEIIKKL